MISLLTRWRVGLSLAAALAFLGLALAANHYRHAYHAEKALRAADRASYVNAQAQAAVIAQEALRAAESRFRSKANEADKIYAASVSDARIRAAAYIDRMRVKTAAGSPSPAPAGTEGGSAGSADRPSGEADLVAVTAADVEICTTNTTRLQAAHDWALGLQTGP